MPRLGDAWRWSGGLGRRSPSCGSRGNADVWADTPALGLAPESVQEIFAQFCLRNAETIKATMATEAMNLGANPGLTDTLPSKAEIDGACDPSLEYDVCDTCVTFADVTPSCSHHR